MRGIKLRTITLPIITFTYLQTMLQNSFSTKPTPQTHICYKRWRGKYTNTIFFLLWRSGPTQAMTSSFLRFLDHKQGRITVGRTPLDAWSALRRGFYLITHNAHKRHTSMPQAGFKSAFPTSERPQAHVLACATTNSNFSRLGTKSGTQNADSFH